MDFNRVGAGQSQNRFEADNASPDTSAKIRRQSSDGAATESPEKSPRVAQSSIFADVQHSFADMQLVGTDSDDAKFLKSIKEAAMLSSDDPSEVALAKKRLKKLRESNNFMPNTALLPKLTENIISGDAATVLGGLNLASGLASGNSQFGSDSADAEALIKAVIQCATSQDAKVSENGLKIHQAAVHVLAALSDPSNSLSGPSKNAVMMHDCGAAQFVVNHLDNEDSEVSDSAALVMSHILRDKGNQSSLQGDSKVITSLTKCIQSKVTRINSLSDPQQWNVAVKASSLLSDLLQSPSDALDRKGMSTLNNHFQKLLMVGAKHPDDEVKINTLKAMICLVSSDQQIEKPVYNDVVLNRLFGMLDSSGDSARNLAINFIEKISTEQNVANYVFKSPEYVFSKYSGSFLSSDKIDLEGMKDIILNILANTNDRSPKSHLYFSSNILNKIKSENDKQSSFFFNLSSELSRNPFMLLSFKEMDGFYSTLGSVDTEISKKYQDSILGYISISMSELSEDDRRNPQAILEKLYNDLESESEYKQTKAFELVHLMIGYSKPDTDFLAGDRNFLEVLSNQISTGPGKARAAAITSIYSIAGKSLDKTYLTTPNLFSNLVDAMSSPSFVDCVESTATVHDYILDMMYNSTDTIESEQFLSNINKLFRALSYNFYYISPENVRSGATQEEEDINSDTFFKTLTLLMNLPPLVDVAKGDMFLIQCMNSLSQSENQDIAQKANNIINLLGFNYDADSDDYNI